MPRPISRIRGTRPSPALVVAIVALVMSMAGTATAARVLIKNSKQIKNGAVSTADVRNSSLTGKDVKDGGLTGSDIKAGSVGVDKLEGDAKRALEDAGTQAIEVYRKAGPSGIEGGKVARVATMSNVPPGVYAIFAKSVLTGEVEDSGLFGQGTTVSGHCRLEAGGDVDEARTLLGTPGANAPSEVSMQITRTFGSTGTVTLDCDVAPSSWRASDTSIIAVRVGKAPRTEVSG